MRFIAAIILLAAAGAITFFVIWPQWDGVAQSRAEVAELQSLQKELSELAAEREALTAEYNAIPEADLNKIKAIAPAERGTSVVLADFETLAGQNSLTLEQVDFTPTGNAASGGGIAAPDPSRYRTIPVTLALRGSYEGLKSFLAALEKNLRLVDVKEVNFSLSRGAEGAIGVKAVIYSQR